MATIKIGNRIVVHPMEGWDGLADGNPSEHTNPPLAALRPQRGKLIWGGEAVAVSHQGRANPNQLVAATHTGKGLSRLRATLIEEHRLTTGSDDGLLIGLQLTDSGRYSRPNAHGRPEPRILYHHPVPRSAPGIVRGLSLADRRRHSRPSLKTSTRPRSWRWKLGFDFVDIKHCHGYLGHEFLSAHTRAGRYGGSFENRTRFLREVVQGIRSIAPQLGIAVRLSAIDSVPFHPDPAKSSNGKLGPGIPEPYDESSPTGGASASTRSIPTESDLDEPARFLSLLEQLGIRLVNITAGSPYYNPHLQRPALYPPSDGYLPPEDPLFSVARQMEATRRLKQQFPHLIFVGTGYSYLQDFLPHVAQAALREGWVDMVGLGRMVLTYPELLWDASEGRSIERKRICRTFSDCTTAPRKGLPSGCYPLDSFYKDSELMTQLTIAKKQLTQP